MKTLGLIGGTSWISTIEYYRLLNEGINARLGGLELRPVRRCTRSTTRTSPRSTSVRIGTRCSSWLARRRRRSQCRRRGAAARRKHHAPGGRASAGSREDSGDSHRRRDRARHPRPGIDRVSLLGTRYTMEKDFFRNRLTAHGITPMIPNDEDRGVHSRHDLRRAGEGNLPAGIEDPIPRDHRPSRERRRAGRDPGLHRNSASHQPARHARSQSSTRPRFTSTPPSTSRSHKARTTQSWRRPVAGATHTDFVRGRQTEQARAPIKNSQTNK